jgi:hypothetical protein
MKINVEINLAESTAPAWLKVRHNLEYADLEF